MKKGELYFVHGNGFPSRCYSQFLQTLSEQYSCYFPDKVGHDPDYPVTENWTCLVEEILSDIENRCREPVIAVGHSLGAVLSFLAAMQKPALFKAVIMLDAPLISPWKSRLVALAKKMGLIDRITPAFQTKNRREHWKTREEVLEYLQSRPLFKTFTSACLHDYVQYGLIEDKDGFHLDFNREVEYSIYRTIPHILPQYQGKLATPTALIYGSKSRVVTAGDRRYMAQQFGIRMQCIGGTHLFPFEIPEQAALRVMTMIEDFLRSS